MVIFRRKRHANFRPKIMFYAVLNWKRIQFSESARFACIWKKIILVLLLISNFIFQTTIQNSIIRFYIISSKCVHKIRPVTNNTLEHLKKRRFWKSTNLHFAVWILLNGAQFIFILAEIIVSSFPWLNQQNWPKFKIIF
jgi:hypothetical protein